MKKLAISLMLGLLSMQSFAREEKDVTLEALLDFKESREVTVNEVDVDRLEVIKQKANTLGIQSGAYYASNKIKDMLEADAKRLDSLYDFTRLGIARTYKGVYLVNPVIVEMGQSITLAPDSRSFILRDQTYIIAKDPYLSLSAPSWRTYLSFSVEPPQVPADMIKPKTANEIALWRSEMLKGYKIGIRQVEQVTTLRFARLTRDILGMHNYELLKPRKIVSDIKIADAYYPVSGGGNRMDIKESRVSIEVNPQLNSNRWNWETVPRLADVTDLFPNGALVNDWVTVNGR